MDKILWTTTVLVLLLTACSVVTDPNSYDDGGLPADPCLQASVDCCLDPASGHGRSSFFVLCSGDVSSQTISETQFCPFDVQNPRLNPWIGESCALQTP